MKRHCVENLGKLSVQLVMVTGGLLLASCSDSSEELVWQEGDTIPVFNGSDLKGWTHVMEGGATGGEGAWSAVDGVLVGKGEPRGYLRTDASFQDFELIIDWRWASEDAEGSSGVLLRIAGDPKGITPKCVEADLSFEGVGDLWAYHGAKLDGDGDRFLEVNGDEELGDFTGIEKIEDAEKSPGEWNRYEITLKGGDLEVRLNDKLVNEATGLDVLSGPIGLQADGGSIQIDFMQVTPL